MSRIGKKQVDIPSGAKITVNAGSVLIEGPKGTMTISVPESIKIEVKDLVVQVTRVNDIKENRARHGLIRNLLNNALIGVTSGHTKKLEIFGVGFKVQMQGENVVFSLGYSHDINYKIPEGITLKIPQQTTVEIEGVDKAAVGQSAAEIRAFFKAEPYKGKGIRYSDENIRRKQGKVVG